MLTRSEYREVNISKNIATSHPKCPASSSLISKANEILHISQNIINTCGENCESQSECNALQVINKKLRPNGPASKAQGAFSFYKVIYNKL